MMMVFSGKEGKESNQRPLGKYDLTEVEGASIRAHYVCIKIIYMCKISKNYTEKGLNLENNYKEEKSGRK